MFFHRGITHFLKYEFSLFTLNLSFKERSLLNLFLKFEFRIFILNLSFELESLFQQSHGRWMG